MQKDYGKKRKIQGKFFYVIPIQNSLIYRKKAFQLVGKLINDGGILINYIQKKVTVNLVTQHSQAIAIYIPKILNFKIKHDIK